MKNKEGGSTFDPCIWASLSLSLIGVFSLWIYGAFHWAVINDLMQTYSSIDVEIKVTIFKILVHLYILRFISCFLAVLFAVFVVKNNRFILSKIALTISIISFATIFIIM